MASKDISHPTRRRRLIWLALPLAAVAIATGIDWSLSRGPQEPALSAAEWGTAGFGPGTYAEASRQIDHQIEAATYMASRNPGDWLRQEGLARALMRRSRVASDYGDLARADAILSKAVGEAPSPAGPLLSQAVLGMMMHRLAVTTSALDAIDRWAVPPDPDELTEVQGLRGDVAFYRGDMAGAQAWYARAAATGPGAGLAYRQANLAKARGDFDGAIRAFAAGSTSREPPFARASTAMQIGAVEQARGRYREAAEWFAAADRQFPGFWLFEAHRAQSRAIGGDLAGGIADLRRIAERSPSAEVMDTLAVLLRAQGQAAESREWAARAKAEWDRRLKLAPEAAYGHALEHELVFGTPERAVELARANLAARPFGESRVLLATALVNVGQDRAALAELARAEDSGWRSAPLYALRARILELAGRTDLAEQARAAAIALNPRIFAPETTLVWLSHG